MDRNKARVVSGRLAIALIALVALLIGAGLSGCARDLGRSPEDASTSSAVRNDPPPLDAQVPAGLKTAVFGLG